MLPLMNLKAEVSSPCSFTSRGRIIATRGPLLLARLPAAHLGELCEIHSGKGRKIAAQVVSFCEDSVSLAPLEIPDGVAAGAQVKSLGRVLEISVYKSMCASVLDALGEPLDPDGKGSGCNDSSSWIPVIRPAPAPLSRKPIEEPLVTGIKSLDGLLTLGKGQRLGLFAPAGLGKSTLLGMLARRSSADINVIALVGERGREVRDFLEEALGPAGLARSIVVAATSNESAIRRLIAPYTATAIAEYFRDAGNDVLLLVDSITRTARAMRDVGLAAGEIPVRQGYPPSVYTELPRLLERAGRTGQGSITAVYTVLSAFEAYNDPLAEEIKSILDGHIVLDPQMARQGVRPAIDPLQSVSRLLGRFHGGAYLGDIETLKLMLARLRRDREMLLFGGKADAELQAALECEPGMLACLSQQLDEFYPLPHTLREISALARKFIQTRSKYQACTDSYEFPPAADGLKKQAQSYDYQ